MMFCIFIASMTQTTSPSRTVSPATASMETTRPGMGEMTSLEVSAAFFSGMRACMSADRGVSTSTRALAARWRMTKPSAAGSTAAVKGTPSTSPRNRALPGRQFTADRPMLRPSAGSSISRPPASSISRMGRAVLPTTTTQSVRAKAPPRPAATPVLRARAAISRCMKAEAAIITSVWKGVGSVPEKPSGNSSTI